jgi:NADH-quinone oxidoreductase subunit H
MSFSFDLWSLWITIILIVAVMGVVLTTCAYLVFVERKVAAYVQDRIGPNRVGPFGLLQPLADGLKFIFKEEILPVHVDRVFYLIAPAVAVSTAFLAFAVVPFGPTSPPPERPWPQTVEAEQKAKDATFDEQVERYNRQIQFVIAPHVDIGLVFFFSVSSLAAYGIILGGWSSNNKYSILGALRSSAQLISYEIPMGMSVLGVVLMDDSLNAETLISRQVAGGWNVLYQPLACLLFLTCVLAECNRLPFDLPEAEQELVGGYHTEYGAMKFALYFLGEYAHMITTSFLLVVLFLGGWHLPGVPEGGEGVGLVILKLVIFAAKMTALILLYMFIRWTIPRFRFDQLMGLAWKVLVPTALVNLVCVMIVKHLEWSQWALTASSAVLLIAAGYFALVAKSAGARETASEALARAGVR